MDWDSKYPNILFMYFLFPIAFMGTREAGLYEHNRRTPNESTILMLNPLTNFKTLVFLLPLNETRSTMGLFKKKKTLKH